MTLVFAVIILDTRLPHELSLSDNYIYLIAHAQLSRGHRDSDKSRKSSSFSLDQQQDEIVIQKDGNMYTLEEESISGKKF